MSKVDLEAIMQLRNRAIAMLKGASWHGVEGNRALICETDDLRIAYAGPFRWAAEIPSEMKHFAAAIDENGPPAAQTHRVVKEAVSERAKSDME
jgi:hypothetical protein